MHADCAPSRHGKKSGRPAQLRADAWASSSFTLFLILHVSPGSTIPHPGGRRPQTGSRFCASGYKPTTPPGCATSALGPFPPRSGVVLSAWDWESTTGVLVRRGIPGRRGWSSSGHNFPVLLFLLDGSRFLFAPDLCECERVLPSAHSAQHAHFHPLSSAKSHLSFFSISS